MVFAGPLPSREGDGWLSTSTAFARVAMERLLLEVSDNAPRGVDSGKKRE